MFKFLHCSTFILCFYKLLTTINGLTLLSSLSSSSSSLIPRSTTTTTTTTRSYWTTNGRHVQLSSLCSSSFICNTGSFLTSLQKRQRRRYDGTSTSSTTSTLCMHMGHSHQHHDHHDHTKNCIDSSSSSSSVVSSVKQKNTILSTSVRIRRYALYLFCAVLTLGRPMLVSLKALSTGGTIGIGDIIRTVRLTDIATFILSILSFNLFIEPISHEIKSAIKRLQNLGTGIAKHSPKSTKSSSSSSTSFFSLTRMLLSSSEIGTGTTTTGQVSLMTNDEKLNNNNLAADRVTILGGFMNIILSAAKFFIGVQCHSSALIADAGHSLSDLFSDFITLWAVQVGRLPPDDDHPYGHGKFEAIGALFLALTLLGTGISVGIMSNRKLIEIIAVQRSMPLIQQQQQQLLPTAPALVMAFLSIVSKEWLFRVTRNVGERINSQVVIANAWHHRSDAYSSVLALFSIALAMAGLAAADAAAGLLVAGMICMTGAEILGESVKQLTDHSDEVLVRRIMDIVANSNDVQSVNRIRARQVGSTSVIDISVCIPEHLSSVSEARVVEDRLRRIILQEDGVLDCDVKATTCPVVPPINDSTTATPTSSTLALNSPMEQHLVDQSMNTEPAPVLTIISKSEVETSIRDAIINNYPQVQSINRVTVHYQDIVTDPINVDVDICLTDTIQETTTIATAAVLAQNVRTTLELYDTINTANIFLDLNYNDIPPTMATSTATTTASTAAGF